MVKRKKWLAMQFWNIEGQKKAPVTQVVQQIMQGTPDEPDVEAQKYIPQARSVAVVVNKGLDPEVTRSKVAELAMNAIANDEEGIEADVPLMEAGVDSLGSVQLVTDLGREFKLTLSPSAVFDFPTVRALADHLVEESLG